jgi:hypothetical protein
VNANDARLTAVFSAHAGSTVEDDAPNAPGPAASFDLVLEAVAGNAIGNGGGPYTLTATAIDETAQTPVPAVSFSAAQAFNGASGWNANGPDFEKTEVVTFSVPTTGVQGHVFHYVASLVNLNAQIVSILESNKFILV